MLTVGGRNYTLEQGCQIELISGAKRYCQNKQQIKVNDIFLQCETLQYRH